MKVNSYLKRRVLTYFWRTYDQQEIDLIEVQGDDLFAYEFKWSDRKAKIPTAWAKNYPDSHYKVIHKDQYLDFVLGKV